MKAMVMVSDIMWQLMSGRNGIHRELKQKIICSRTRSSKTLLLPRVSTPRACTRRPGHRGLEYCNSAAKGKQYERKMDKIARECFSHSGVPAHCYSDDTWKHSMMI